MKTLSKKGKTIQMPEALSNCDNPPSFTKYDYEVFITWRRNKKQ